MIARAYKPVNKYNCPYCPQSNLNLGELRGHCNAKHPNGRKDVVCPVCSSMPWGQADLKSIDFMGHLNFRHKYDYSDYVDFSVTEDQMLNKVINQSITASITQQMSSMTVSNSKNSLDINNNVNNNTKANNLNWKQNEMIKYKAYHYTIRFTGSLNNIKDKKFIKTETEPCELYLCPGAFSKGSNRNAHTALLLCKNDKNYHKKVAKRSLSQIVSSIQTQIQLIENQIIAAYLANIFFKEFSLEKTLRFIDVSLIQLHNRIFYTIEDYMSGNFLKWNNNFGFVNEELYSNTLNAFSHWTYDITNGYLVVTDLQGMFESDNGEYILTDPAICCTDSTRFSTTNLGLSGIRKFFESHQCNAKCKQFGLSRNIYQKMPDKPDYQNSVQLLNF